MMAVSRNVKKEDSLNSTRVYAFQNILLREPKITIS